jgi:hypothetical protein
MLLASLIHCEHHQVVGWSLSGAPRTIHSHSTTGRMMRTELHIAATSYIPQGRNDPSKQSVHFLMKEFCLPSTGEQLDLYKILKIPHNANRLTIKSAYRNLSRRYHPDGPYLLNQKQKNCRSPKNIVWPGSCNNEHDVKKHWDRVSFAYTILSNKTLRTRYDRNEALSDPGKALQRACMDVTEYCVSESGKCLWNVSVSVISNTMKTTADVVKAFEYPKLNSQDLAWNSQQQISRDVSGFLTIVSDVFQVESWKQSFNSFPAGALQSLTQSAAEAKTALDKWGINLSREIPMAIERLTKLAEHKSIQHAEESTSYGANRVHNEVNAPGMHGSEIRDFGLKLSGFALSALAFMEQTVQTWYA